MVATLKETTELANIRNRLIFLEEAGYTDVRLDITRLKTYIPLRAWRKVSKRPSV